MSLLGLLLLLGMAPAQDYLRPLTPEELAQGLMRYQAQHARRLDPIQIDQLQTNGSTCFAIRSYIFKREDGQAPVLAGTTTCTPADTLREKRVGNPNPMLVPLGFAPAK